MKLFTPVLIIFPFALASAQVPTPAPAGASRSAYVSGDAQESYLTGMKARIAINTRKHDPFGLSQDPDRAVRPPNDPFSRPSGPSLFAQAVADLPITAIMASANQFLIGARVFSKGDVFPIRKAQTLVRVRVEEVNLDSIDFTAVEGGEKATRSLAIDPRARIKQGDPHLPEGLYEESEVPEVVVP